MSWITARRRHRVAGYAVVPLGLAAIGVMYAALSGPGGQAAASSPPASAQSIAEGKYLFEQSCSSCHGIDAQGTAVAPSLIGAGGALTYGKYAPALTASTPAQIYEAMQTGPEAMPVFGDGAITPSEKRDIIAYVTGTRSEQNPGGFSLGRIGPVTEGLVAWIGGIGLLVLAALWITAKRREA